MLNRQTLEKAEFDFLEQARSKIKECLDATKEVLDLLPKERIEYLASISPEFRQIVNQIGVEKTRTFLENYLAELYMLNQDNFKELREKLENIKKEEQTYESLNAQVRALAQEYNIPIEELSRVYASGGNLQELVRAHLGIIGKLRDMFGGRFSRGRAEQLDRIEEVQTKLAEIDNNLQEIGKMIAEAVFASQNERGRELLSDILYGIADSGKNISFKEAGGILEEVEDQSKLEKEWNEFLQEEGIKWEEIQARYLRKKYKDEFKDWYKNKRTRAKCGGLLTYILNIISQNLDSFLQNK